MNSSPFYDELSSLVRRIPKHNVIVIGGDMNAQIGKNGNHKYSLHNSSNRNGQHLTDFTIENTLTCLNTNFQKREAKLWTHTYANNTKAQIDYVFTKRKWKNSAINCEANSSFEGVSSDRRMVTAKIRLRPTKKRHTNSDHQTLWLGLSYNRDIRDKYVLALRNNSMHYRRRQKCVPWMTNMRISSIHTSRQQRNAYHKT